jgi:hypothetical protein
VQVNREKGRKRGAKRQKRGNKKISQTPVKQCRDKKAMGASEPERSVNEVYQIFREAKRQDRSGDLLGVERLLAV